MEHNNDKARYFQMDESNDGLVRYTATCWVRVQELNRIDKHDWIRFQGQMTPPMQKALKSKLVFQAVEMFPDRKCVEGNEI